MHILISKFLKLLGEIQLISFARLIFLSGNLALYANCWFHITDVLRRID